MKNIGAKREKKRVKQLRLKEERRKRLAESAEKVRKLQSGTTGENLGLPTASILYSYPELLSEQKIPMVIPYSHPWCNTAKRKEK
jgi:hypothetical protein